MIAINQDEEEALIDVMWERESDRFVLVMRMPDGEETVMVRDGNSNPFIEACAIVQHWKDRNGRE